MSRAAVANAALLFAGVQGHPRPLDTISDTHPLEALVQASSPAAQAFDARCDELGRQACLALCAEVLFGLRSTSAHTPIPTSDE